MKIWLILTLILVKYITLQKINFTGTDLFTVNVRDSKDAESDVDNVSVIVRP